MRVSNSLIGLGNRSTADAVTEGYQHPTLSFVSAWSSKSMKHIQKFAFCKLVFLPPSQPFSYIRMIDKSAIYMYTLSHSQYIKPITHTIIWSPWNICWVTSLLKRCFSRSQYQSEYQSLIKGQLTWIVLLSVSTWRRREAMNFSNGIQDSFTLRFREITWPILDRVI